MIRPRPPTTSPSLVDLRPRARRPTSASRERPSSTSDAAARRRCSVADPAVVLPGRRATTGRGRSSASRSGSAPSRPGSAGTASTSRTCSSAPGAAGPGTAGRCCAELAAHRRRARATAGSSGRCWTGTSRRRPSTRARRQPMHEWTAWRLDGAALPALGRTRRPGKVIAVCSAGQRAHTAPDSANGC